MHHFPHLHNLHRRKHRTDVYGFGIHHQLHDPALLIHRWIANDQLQHKAINLGFRQGVGAFLFDGILGGHHKEGSGQSFTVVSDGNLTFLHSLQERGLHFGWRPVNLVCQDEIGKDRSFFGAEFRRFLVKYQSAGDVCR